MTSLERPAIVSGRYGYPDPDLIAIDLDGVQLSPLAPDLGRPPAERFDSRSLADLPDTSLEAFAIAAPSGVLDRRFVLAHALRVLRPGGTLTALAPKDKGGARLAKELTAFGCTVEEASRRHHRICRVTRPEVTTGLAAAIAAGEPQMPPALGLWSQPGIFSWDRPDPGSLALIRTLPPFAGAGADFGCGVGVLAQSVLRSADVTRLTLIDIDRRAVEAAQRNVPDTRATFLWGDIRRDGMALRDLDFVVMNPPFHDGGIEDRALGEAFIHCASASLRPGGACWLVANRHLPYEAALRSRFAKVSLVQQDAGYKIYEARR